MVFSKKSQEDHSPRYKVYMKHAALWVLVLYAGSFFI